MNLTEAKAILLKNGVNPDFTGGFPEKYLWACKDGNLELVKAYLACGVDINYHSKEYGESTALVKAAEGGHSVIIEYLLKNGAIHDGVLDADGDTGLHTAVNWGKLEAVKTFIENGTSANNLNKKDLTPLESALEHGHAAIYEYLMKFSSPDAYHELGKSIIQKAIKNNKQRIIQDAFNKFAIKPDVNLKDENGNNLLQLALIYGAPSSTIDIILINEPEIHSPNHWGWTAYFLNKALDINHPFIEKSGNPESGNEVYEVYIAYKNEDFQKLLDLKKQGKNLSIKSPKGYNLVAQAIVDGKSLEYIKKLFSLDLDLSEDVAEYESLVSFAYNNNQYEVARFLLDNGVNPNHSKGYFGNKYYGVIYNFYENEQIEELIYLHSKGAIFNDLTCLISSLVYGAKPRDYKIKFIQSMKEWGGSVNIKDEFATLLGDLCSYMPNEYKLIEAIIQEGANVNIEVNETPLLKLTGSYKTESSIKKVTQLLLENGASFESESNFGGNVAYKLYVGYGSNQYAKQAVEEFLENHLNKILKKNKVKSVEELSESAQKEFAETQSYGKLMCWIGMNRTDVAKVLIHHGIPVNPQEPNLMATPLTLAIDRKNVELVELLLKNGANPNYPLKYNSYPIFSLVSTEHYEPSHLKMLDLMIKYGVNVNQTTPYSNVIYSAFHKPQLPIIQKLLENGVDFDSIKETVLLRCLDNWEVFQYAVSKGANINVCDENGNTLLMLAIQKNKPEIFDFLIDKVDVAAKNLKGEDALFIAVQVENIEVVKKLLEKGLDPHSQNTEGNSAYKLAKFRPHLKPVLGIQAEDDEVLSNVWENKPISPFIKAVYNRDIIAVEEHIKNGGDINETNYRGDSALIIAILTNQEDIAEILILKGIDLSLTNDLGYSALSYANAFYKDRLKEKMDKKNPHLLSMDVINAQASIMMDREKFWEAYKANDTFRIIEMIQSKKVDVVCPDYNFFILHEAIKSGNLGLAKALLEVGSLPDVIDSDLWDAFYYAEENQFSDFIEIMNAYKK